VDRALWERAVLDQWNGSSEVSDFTTFVQQNDVINVQEEWDRFQSLLVTCILGAYSWLACVGLLPPEIRANCDRLARQSDFKGQLAVYRCSSCAHAGVRHLVGDMAIRKKRRLLARCFQLKRLLLRQNSVGLSAVQNQELAALKVQLTKHFGDALTLRHLVVHIADIQRDLHSVESSQRNHSIASWRHKMVTSDAELSRWLKNRSANCAASVIDQSGYVTESDVEAAAAVSNFWSDFWQRARARQPSFSDRVASLLAGLPSFQVCQWDPPSASLLQSTARGGRGSHGPDGWVAREIGSLPLPVFELFSLLGARWMQSAQVPGQFLESRMISLVKPGKIVDHTIGVDNLRPITVLSCWYRIWASAWIKNSLKDWMRIHVPAHFAVAHATACGQVAVDLLDNLMSAGYLASLDYSKAFDLLDPLVTRSLLLHLGWDPSLLPRCGKNNVGGSPLALILTWIVLLVLLLFLRVTPWVRS
jgi:hypothetical protein